MADRQLGSAVCGLWEWHPCAGIKLRENHEGAISLGRHTHHEGSCTSCSLLGSHSWDALLWAACKPCTKQGYCDHQDCKPWLQHYCCHGVCQLEQADAIQEWLLKLLPLLAAETASAFSCPSAALLHLPVAGVGAQHEGYPGAQRQQHWRQPCDWQSLPAWFEDIGVSLKAPARLSDQ